MPLLALLVLALLVATSLPATAQDRERQSRDVAEFSKIALSVPATLHLRQADERSVEVEATPEALDQIETTIDGETLEIRSERESSWLDWFRSSNFSDDDIDIYVTAPSIEALNLAGSGRVVGDSPFEGDSFAFDIAGSGELDLDLTVQRLEINVAGSGTAHLEGQVDTATVSISGSGDIHLQNVTDLLDASIAGSGNVWYGGRPKVETSIQGSGSVRAKE